MAHSSYRTAPPCEATCPCRAPQAQGTACSCGIFACGKDGPYCDRLVDSSGALRAPATLGEMIADMKASWDAMAAQNKAKARERVRDRSRPQCAENVGSGVKIHQCTYSALPGSLYCGRHPRKDATDDFESAPAGLQDMPDTLPW